MLVQKQRKKYERFRRIGKNGLPSTQSMMSSRHMPAIAGGKEVLGRGVGEGRTAICVRLPLSPHHDQSLKVTHLCF